MQTKIRVNLVERGAAQVVSKAEWILAGCAFEASELVRRGIIKITPSATYLLIEPKTQIGTFDSPGLLIDVKPKFPAIMAAVSPLLALWRRSVNQPIPSPQASFDRESDLWRTFQTLLFELCREGIPWAYRSRDEETSTPRGRILFRETVSRLYSKGITHRVFSRRPVRRYVTDLGSALDTVRRKLKTLDGTHATVESEIIRLIELVGDRTIIQSEYHAISVMDELETFEDRPALARIIKFCRDVLGNIQPFRTSEKFGRGVAEFIDMEKLWENAIQLLLQLHSTRANEDVVIHSLRGRKVQLFSDGGPSLDPDILIFRDDETFAVVDAKYSSAKSPSADDVYQLTCYVSKLNAPIGILAYVAIGEQSEIQQIGTLEGGAILYACFFALDAFNNRGVFLDSILGPYAPLAEVS